MTININKLHPMDLLTDKAGRVYRVVGIFLQPSIIIEQLTPPSESRAHIGVGGSDWDELELKP